jgi:hypothetical protein
MSADGHDFHFETTERKAATAVLDGVEALVNAPGLELVKDRVDGAALRALMEISRIVAAHDAADSTTR